MSSGSRYASVFPGNTYSVRGDAVPGATSYSWYSSYGVSFGLYRTTSTTSHPSNYVRISPHAYPGSYRISVLARNACGSAYMRGLTLVVSGGWRGGGGGDRDESDDGCPRGFRPPCEPSDPNPISNQPSSALYPNPASAQVQVTILGSEGALIDPAEIVIRDRYMRERVRQQAYESPAKVSLHGFLPDVYYVQVNHPLEQKQYQLMVK